MSNAERLGSKIEKLEYTARWLGTMGKWFTGLGVAYIGFILFKLLMDFRPDRWIPVVDDAMSTMPLAGLYLLIGWVMLRLVDAVSSTADLIREVGEIV